MNCVMCEVANISPFSGQPSFEVSVCPHEHYQCVRCDNENQNHCGLCGEGTYLIYLDLRFAAAQSDTASSGNLWQNEDYWDNWPRESWSMVKFRGTYEQSSSSMIAPRYWNPGCRQPIDDLDLGEDSIGQLDEMKAESSSNTSNDLREIWNAKDFKSGLKYFVAKESDIVKGHFYKEQQLILSPLYLHKAESHAIAKKSTTIIGIRALQQGFPSGSHDSKLKSITTISNSFTNSKVMYLEDYTAEEKRLLIGYPNRDKISGGHCLQDDAVKDEKKELFTGEYTSLYRTAERAPTKDQKAYQLEPHVVDHKDIPLSFFRPKEPKKTLQTLFFKNISGTYPTMKGLPLDYFSAVQKHPFSIPKRPVKLLWSEPRSMISSTPRNQLSLVRRVRFGGKNFKGLHSEVVTCPEDLVADLQVLKSRKGKVMLPIPVHGLGRNFQFPKCPDFDCGEYLYSSNMNDHMALLHGNRVVESLELNQPKSFCLDLRSSNRKVLILHFSRRLHWKIGKVRKQGRMMWPGRNRRENRSKESDTQFAKCNKSNEKCENEEESSASATILTTKKGQRQEQEQE
ncbi:uncharacterized protein LOC121467848 isoform X2 [Drosophila elegans]|uniref:uncharacterized protein LOC121467848 isoform X2 n=1 Tax=Drosophila elegans TaxID=30023 RepID=UPI001BC861FE|nr:uncharacterized protein LOC121467848 isoform X2 [Drosophila elegans]